MDPATFLSLLIFSDFLADGFNPLQFPIDVPQFVFPEFPVRFFPVQVPGHTVAQEGDHLHEPDEGKEGYKHITHFFLPRPGNHHRLQKQSHPLPVACLPVVPRPGSSAGCSGRRQSPCSRCC